MVHINRLNENATMKDNIGDVMRYICVNLPKGICVAKSLYSVQQGNGRYRAKEEPVKINGIKWDEKGIGSWLLMLEDGSTYSLALVMEDLKKGRFISEVLPMQ